MLVVITIIALLTSVLLPAVKRSKEQAKRSLCAANLHNLHLGATMFAQDRDNKLGPLAGSGVVGGEYLPGYWQWDGNTPRVCRADYYMPGFMEYFNFSREIFYCPSNPAGPDTGYFHPGFTASYSPSWGWVAPGNAPGRPAYWLNFTYNRLFEIQHQDSIELAELITDTPDLGLFADQTTYNLSFGGFLNANHPWISIVPSLGIDENGGAEADGRNMVTLNGDVRWARIGDEEKLRLRLYSSMYVSY